MGRDTRRNLSAPLRRMLPLATRQGSGRWSTLAVESSLGGAEVPLPRLPTMVTALAAFSLTAAPALAQEEGPPRWQELRSSKSIIEGIVVDAREEFDDEVGPTIVYE